MGRIISFLNSGLIEPLKAELSVFFTENYDLIVIEDGEVPLAKGANHMNYFFLLIAVLVLIAVAALTFTWAGKRAQKKSRLIELKKKAGKGGSVPFTIKGIENEITKTEAEMAAAML